MVGSKAFLALKVLVVVVDAHVRFCSTEFDMRFGCGYH